MTASGVLIMARSRAPSSMGSSSYVGVNSTANGRIPAALSKARKTTAPSKSGGTVTSNSYRRMALILAFAVVATPSGAGAHSISLDGDDWTVTNSNRTISIPAQVPGGIYSDLWRADILSDPYFKYNDVEQRWVCYDKWTWRKQFSVPAAARTSPNVNLVFHGVDTAANISLNGNDILKTNNMFSRYAVDVRSLLNENDNELIVTIDSPILYALEKFSYFFQNNYTVYPTGAPWAQNGENHVNFIRKMQSSFSWDWGPAFPSLGIWKNVEVEYYEEVHLRDVIVGMRENGHFWNVTLVLYLEGNQLPDEIPVNVDLEKIGQIYSGSEKVINGSVTVSNINISEKKVSRWWPNGFGKQTLYQLQVVAGESSKNVRIGFRTVELVQNTIAGVTGLNFFFKVNGWPIYAKGSNLIPVDVLPERVTAEKIRSLMLAAKDANMNMLRIWGGGIYEQNALYDAADELGILLWQDFMFACALYPTNKEFLDSVSEEVGQNVRRLQHHPSIALWAGNNENEEAIASSWWPLMKFHESRYKEDYRTLYVHTIKPIVEKLDPWRSYLVSSPTNGIQSEKEDYISDSPNSDFYGDVHFYDYLMDSWQSNNFPTSRFVSEFGFQSFPSLRTWQQATNDSDDLVYPLTAFPEDRQHHSVVLIIPGNANIERSVSMKFGGPKASLSSQEKFRVFCYLSQIYQAVSVKTGVEKFRRDRSKLDRKSGTGHNMGALYWQLNDIWQAPTWASLEYDGTWKMLHNYARNFFEPLLITAHHEEVSWQNKNHVEVWMISDLEGSMPVNIQVALYNFSSFSPVKNLTLQMDICADCSMEVVTLKVEELFTEGCSPTTCFVIVSMRDANDALMSDNWLLLEVPKMITTMVDSNVQIEDVQGPQKMADGRYAFEVKVQGNAPAPFTWLESGDIQGHFTDNGFFLYEPKKITQFVTASSNVTASQLAKAISVIEYSRVVDLP